MEAERSRCAQEAHNGGGYCEHVLHQEMDLALCVDLERLADQLPSLPATGKLRRLSVRISDSSKRWVDADEKNLIDHNAAASQARILDSVHAEDVVEAIWDYWRAPTPQGASLLGYMLRGLFDGRRRGIALERLALGCSQCQSSEID